MQQLSTSDAPNSAPAGGCHPGSHVNVGGICLVCGEWQPVARCRDGDCHWQALLGEQTLLAAVAHYSSTGHSIRVLVN